MGAEYKHTPVLLNEVIDGLNLSQNKNIVDCTLGGAGHAKEILKRILPKGKLIGFDLDPASIKNAEIVFKNYKDNVILINRNFKNIKEEIDNLGINIDGILLDLGMSSYELSDKERGFSFSGKQPLNMSFSGNEKHNAEYVINSYTVKQLDDIIRNWGDEKDSYKIATEIIKYRKNKSIRTTDELVYIICKAKNCLDYLAGKNKWRYKIHPATKTFQAIRMEVNDEINNLRKVLEDGINVLSSRGRMVVITFHSTEDRIVKNYFNRESKDCICDPDIPICVCNHKKTVKIINKKPIVPSREEVESNPRSRSAKLRIIEKI
ncbi:MAG TPA: 16S rRNA (cytosine(1402)-N(4))-methyltransferase RsmH [bacterium]|nr:16S rRNA (cytosine(1402)-N(4))-methyltransferase RsmH [bacterium]